MKPPEVRMIPIPFKGLRRCIRRTLLHDVSMPKYHEAAPQSNEAMCAHTYGSILHAREALPPLKAYKLMSLGIEIGFTVLTHEPFPLLYSFGLNPEFRNPELHDAWLQALNEKFNQDAWLVGITMRNTRAMRFFLNHGFAEAHTDSNNQFKFLVCPSHS